MGKCAKESLWSLGAGERLGTELPQQELEEKKVSTRLNGEGGWDSEANNVRQESSGTSQKADVARHVWVRQDWGSMWRWIGRGNSVTTLASHSSDTVWLNFESIFLARIEAVVSCKRQLYDFINISETVISQSYFSWFFTTEGICEV